MVLLGLRYKQTYLVEKIKELQKKNDFYKIRGSRQDGDPAGSMKKSILKRVIGLFVIINIPENCDGNLIDL